MEEKESSNIPPRTMNTTICGTKTIVVTHQTYTWIEERHTIPRNRSEVMVVRLQNVSLYP
jgi:hypothetical protein